MSEGRIERRTHKGWRARVLDGHARNRNPEWCKGGVAFVREKKGMLIDSVTAPCVICEEISAAEMGRRERWRKANG